jgi:hypothetical protein
MINIFKNVISAIKESQTGVTLVLGLTNIFAYVGSDNKWFLLTGTILVVVSLVDMAFIETKDDEVY